jgi:hypothetical protein
MTICDTGPVMLTRIEPASRFGSVLPAIDVAEAVLPVMSIAPELSVMVTGTRLPSSS